MPFLTGFRINPIIYDRAVQDQLVNDIIDQGLALDAAGDPNAVDATVAALVFTTPLMKVVGFSEEREWRPIYMPPQEGSTPPLQFHPRRDFLAPFITLQDLWKVRSGAPRTGSRRAAPPTVLVAAKAIMVGPSGNLKLNVRAMQKVITQHRPSLGAPDQSAYRIAA